MLFFQYALKSKANYNNKKCILYIISGASTRKK